MLSDPVWAFFIATGMPADQAEHLVSVIAGCMLAMAIIFLWAAAAVVVHMIIHPVLH